MNTKLPVTSEPRHSILEIYACWLEERTVYSVVLISSGRYVYTFDEDAECLIDAGYKLVKSENTHFMAFPLSNLGAVFAIYDAADCPVLCHRLPFNKPEDTDYE